jgi:hypothetical protein
MTRHALLAAAFACSACTGEIDDPEYYDPAAEAPALAEDEEPDFHGEDVLADDSVLFAGTVKVGDYAAGHCSTAALRPLSMQIAREINCMSPGTLKRMVEGNGIKFTSGAVIPYLEADAVADLKRVANATGSVRINSAFRSVAQQWLLYRWWQQGRCGIAAAARPGLSNHESARAVDLANWSAVKTAMKNRGWAHNVPGDVVHFEHLSSPDIRGMDVRAFQRLWNRNHPGDKIAVDGIYGPQTSARIAKSPIGGFAKGPTCD